MVQGFFIMLLRQYFEAGINEVEEELDEMEGCALKIVKPEESIWENGVRFFWIRFYLLIWTLGQN